MKRKTLIKSGYAARHRDNWIVTGAYAAIVIIVTSFVLYNVIFIWSQ